MAKVFLGIGSNIGDKLDNCKEAIRRVGALDGVILGAVSELYVTRSVGGPEQEDYINGVISISTQKHPKDLLIELKQIEVKMGRIPAAKDYPRIIDIDILFYDDIVVRGTDLIVPHPRVQDRYFALKGLVELAPELVHPLSGRTIDELYREVCSKQ